MSELTQHSSHREPYWDCLKAALIFLVILGHVIKYHVGNGSIGMGIYNYLYVFHMPLFIFISGRFSRKKSNKRYIRSIIRLLETYIVFQLIQTLLTDFIYYHNGFDLKKFIFTPEWAMWYLLALACWRLLIMAIPEKWLKDYPKLFIILSFVIGLSSGFIHLDVFFTSHHILSSLPFFMLGYYSPRVDIRETISHIPSWVAWSAFLILSVVFCVWLNNKKFYYILTSGYSYYYKPFFSVFGSFIASCVVYVLAIFTSTMFMRIIPSNKKMAQWGAVTLIAYVYHPPLIVILNKMLTIFSLHPSLIILFVIAVAMTTFLFYISRYKFVNILVNPVTYWKAEKNSKDNNWK